MADLSRREFTALAAAVAAAPLAVNRVAGGPAITAQDLIDRIKKHIGVEWKAETVDGFKAGDPSIVITGVATTSMATLAVLQQAVKAGANLVITTHPTFYARTDATSPPAARRGAGPAAPGRIRLLLRRPRPRILSSPPRTTSSPGTGSSSFA